jgi:hypothetical protein
MPAYVQHHTIESAAVLCPACIGLLPMYVRDVEPHWNLAKIDFIYECSDCGAEVRHTVTRPERLNTTVSQVPASVSILNHSRLDHARQKLAPLHARRAEV